jgi:predicted DNA-binding transcriptional regulator AlpA
MANLTHSRSTLGAVAYLTRDQLCQRWDISRATSYRYEQLGYLPKPVRLGPGAARWPLSEVEAIERRAAEDRGAAS